MESIAFELNVFIIGLLFELWSVVKVFLVDGHQLFEFYQ